MLQYGPDFRGGRQSRTMQNSHLPGKLKILKLHSVAKPVKLVK